MAEGIRQVPTEVALQESRRTRSSEAGEANVLNIEGLALVASVIALFDGAQRNSLPEMVIAGALGVSIVLAHTVIEYRKATKK